MIGLGLLIGYIEEWSISDALYFTFVTGLTIGYGYNTTWLIERHGFRPPAAIRPAQLPPAAKAA